MPGNHCSYAALWESDGSVIGYKPRASSQAAGVGSQGVRTWEPSRVWIRGLEPSGSDLIINIHLSLQEAGLLFSFVWVPWLPGSRMHQQASTQPRDYEWADFRDSETKKHKHSVVCQHHPTLHCLNPKPFNSHLQEAVGFQRFPKKTDEREQQEWSYGKKTKGNGFLIWNSGKK